MVRLELTKPDFLPPTTKMRARVASASTYTVIFVELGILSCDLVTHVLELPAKMPPHLKFHIYPHNTTYLKAR